VGIATFVMTLVILIFAEVTPKSLATQHSERVSLRVAKVLNLMIIVLSPVIHLLILLTDRVIRLFGGKTIKEKPFITEEEFMTIVTVGHEEGVLEVEEKQMIHNIVEFGDSQVKDIMTPRTDMTAVSADASYAEVLRTFKREGFSRIPVYEDSTDNILGILYVKDLIFLETDPEAFDARTHIREAFFTYEFKGTSALFKEMRKGRIPIAIVLDEYGGTAGLVTIEDLVEEIVGEIEDEYDEEKEDILVLREDEYIVGGSVRIAEVNALLGTRIESEDFDSIGGFVIGQMGRLPQKGETVVHNGTKFIVHEISKNRIVKLKIHT
jgi:putative hemolysin